MVNMQALGCAYSGMDIVDKICDDVKTEDSNGTVSKRKKTSQSLKVLHVQRFSNFY